MPARSRTKSASKDRHAKIPRSKEKPTDSVSDIEKENKSHTARTRSSKAQAKTASDPTHIQNDTYCLCNLPDDGSPMVYCSECFEWYHFQCVRLSVEQAEELEVYVCPTCTENTGRRMIMQWEGPEPDHRPDFINVLHDEGFKELVRLPTPPPALSPSDSEDDPDSEDDYVAGPEPVKGKRSSRRRTRHAAYVSDSDHHSDTVLLESGISEERGASPATTSHLKRKSGISHPAREPKRKKSSDTPVSVDDDPARKYCLGKLRDMLRPVFLRYPHLDAGDGSGSKIELKAENLTDEDKQRLQSEADTFSSELEQCLFELYGEPDKHGKQGVGPKYKDRFRRLTFNLNEEDRVAVHKQICCATISAKELSQMSSTDLANDETKQSIKLAEKEALEHSILKKTLIPRAKITHKGLQDIEDVNGDSATLLREREKEREKEEDERREEERRERERQARLKAAEQQQRDRANSISQGSVPPNSPIPSQSATWSGPSPMQHGQYSPPMADNTRSPVHPLFAPSASDIRVSPEPELDIADLIHLDDEPAPQDTFDDHPSTPALEVSAIPSESGPPVPVPPLMIPPSSSEQSPVIGTSPTHLIKPETPIRASFDLNALWTSPKIEPAPREITREAEAGPKLEQQHRGHPIEVDPIDREATDQDFDMILEKDQDAEVSSDARPQDPEAMFQTVSPVWTGKVAMPLDSSIPQLAPVVARQAGGRTLSANSPLWKTLFPTDTLRIDGRVPTENSAQFLLQTRLNPQKELIACAFSPEGGDGVLQTFSDFLMNKNRHGLVFPWGHQPKDYHPGKELYMVPLLASMPLPDFIELLDDLRLPKVRRDNYVIGIWILVRGKLAPLPALPAISLPLPQPSAPSAPSLPSALQAYPQLANSALAAEVAALTPEQIQAILRALSSGNGGIPGISGGLASAMANVAHVPHPPPPPPTVMMSPTGAPPVPHGRSSWASSVPGFPILPMSGTTPASLPGPTLVPGPSAMPPHAHTPPQPQPQPGPSGPIPSQHAHALAGIHQPPSGPRAGGGFGQGRFDREDGPNHPDARYRDERGEPRGTGWQPSNGRGRPRGRPGRGRSGSGDRGDFVGRPVDAGWGRHHGSTPSGPGQGQDDRSRWDSGPSPSRRWGS